MLIKASEHLACHWVCLPPWNTKPSISFMRSQDLSCLSSFSKEMGSSSSSASGRNRSWMLHMMPFCMWSNCSGEVAFPNLCSHPWKLLWGTGILARPVLLARGVPDQPVFPVCRWEIYVCSCFPEVFRCVVLLHRVLFPRQQRSMVATQSISFVRSSGCELCAWPVGGWQDEGKVPIFIFFTVQAPETIFYVPLGHEHLFISGCACKSMDNLLREYQSWFMSAFGASFIVTSLTKGTWVPSCNCMEKDKSKIV